MWPFTRVQKFREGETCVTGSLVVPHIYEPLEGLNKALVNLREPEEEDSHDKAAAKARSCGSNDRRFQQQVGERQERADLPRGETALASRVPARAGKGGCAQPAHEDPVWS